MNIIDLVKYKLKLVFLYSKGLGLYQSDFAKSFDTIAFFYDQVWQNNRIDILNQIIDSLPIEDSTLIFDIGSGTGNTIRKLQQVYPSAQFLGLDSSRNMLKVSRQKLGSKKILFMHDTIENGLKRLVDNQFDFVVSAWSMGYIKDKNLYKEIYRVLKPGAKFLLVLNTENAFNEVRRSIEYTMQKHHEHLQKVMVETPFINEESLNVLFSKYFDVIKSARVEHVIKINSEKTIIDWALDSGILAGYEYLLDLRNYYNGGKTFEDYFKANYDSLTNDYIWYYLQRK